MNKSMHSSFFIAINFEIWVYKDIKIHFLLETLGLAQMAPFHTTLAHIKKASRLNQSIYSRDHPGR